MNWYKESQTEYKGEHEAPDATSGSPLYNLSGIYPDDIYSMDATRLYSSGESFDSASIGIIQSARNKPNYPVTVYRAVPDINKDISDKIKYYINLCHYINKFGFPPMKDLVGREIFVNHDRDKEKTINYLYSEIEKLNLTNQKSIGINSGDWVTINRQYAKDHGESNLGGKYKIISKTVRAKNLFTTGDSIHEWGYVA